MEPNRAETCARLTDVDFDQWLVTGNLAPGWLNCRHDSGVTSEGVMRRR